MSPGRNNNICLFTMSLKSEKEIIGYPFLVSLLLIRAYKGFVWLASTYGDKISVVLVNLMQMFVNNCC